MIDPFSASGGLSPASQQSATAPAQNSATQTFLNYMKETPAQQFEDSWLAAHHLTEQQLANMSPAQREGIIKEMQQDMQAQITKKLQKNDNVAA